MSFKVAANVFISWNDRVKNQVPKDQKHKHTNPAHAAEVLITQQTGVGMAQTRLIDPKVTKRKIKLTDQTKVIKKEGLHKMLRCFSSKILWTE